VAGIHIDYRPRKFSEMVGNEDIINELENILDKIKNGHGPKSFMFVGPSGCGKTTLARILSNELGCVGNDLKEIDAADVRGIDAVRDILHQMKLRPLTSPCRVWIIDEAHRITGDGQSALLKALEDTPSHVYFMLCTTDPEKLLDTIRGRCTTFRVSELNVSQLVGLMEDIGVAENTTVPKDVLKILAENSYGSPRKALIGLDKVVGLPVEQMKKVAREYEAMATQIIDLCRAMIEKKSWGTIAGIIEKMEEEPEKVRHSILRYMDKVMLGSKGKDQDSEKKLARAYLIADAFRTSFFSNGRPSLTLACYQALYSD
jgi:DNA polymerase III subunit gamma/tau